PSPERRRLSSVRQREQKYTVISLIRDNRQIQELIDGHGHLRRTGNSVAPPRLERTRKRIHDRNRFGERVDRQDSACLRIKRQRSRINTNMHSRRRTVIRIEGTDDVSAAGNRIEKGRRNRRVEDNACWSRRYAANGRGCTFCRRGGSDINGVQHP